jgi:hypothetical protein
MIHQFIVHRLKRWFMHKERVRVYNAKVPKQFAPAVRCALRRYPELHHVKLSFRYRNIGTTMSAVPAAFYVLFHLPRKYYINIREPRNKDGILLLSQADFNQQVGCIAHELTHVADYETYRIPDFIYFGLNYLLFKKFRKRIEKRTDLATVARGFGKQLHSFAKRKIDFLDDKKRNWFLNRYISPDELAIYVEKYASQELFFKEAKQ